MITLYKLAHIVSPPDVFSVPPLEITHDWHGLLLPVPMQVHVVLTPEALLVGYCMPFPAQFTVHTEEFVEGLWEEDVAEVFVAGENGTPYREFNIHPSGAWWSALFSDYRQRIETGPAHGVNTWREIEGNSWRAVLAIPRSYLAPFSPANCRLHLCGITGGETRIHWSSRPHQGKAPDFHAAQCFQRITLR